MFTISIDPLLFVGPFVIRWSLLIVVIAVGIGIWLAAREAERKGIGKDNVYEVAGWIVIAGIAECLKQWAQEVDDMSLVVWETLFVKLSAVEAEDKQTQGTFQGIGTTRETTGFASQTCQVVT